MVKQRHALRECERDVHVMLNEEDGRFPGQGIQQALDGHALLAGEASEGFVENDWVGATLQLGDAVRLEVTIRCARCVMTTLPQPGLAAAPEVLRAICTHNDACVGVYARVLQGGTVRPGDQVTRT